MSNSVADTGNNSPLKFTITPQSCTIVDAATSSFHIIPSTASNYAALTSALRKRDFATARQHLTPAASIATWSRDRFTFKANRWHFDGEPLPETVNKRIVDTAAEGGDPTPLLRFFERLQQNPSQRSATQLYDFLVHQGIPIVEDGCFLAYKGVREDYRDVHSGQFDNKPGNVHSMPRNRVSDDPRTACHEGFHVGAERYARDFGERVVACKVAPEDVVCVPYDHSSQKMRVCKYEVVGYPGEQRVDEASMPSTVTETPQRATERELEKKWHRFTTMSPSELLLLPIATLRDFAAALGVVGAGKIEGGKTALVSVVMSALS